MAYTVISGSSVDYGTGGVYHTPEYSSGTSVDYTPGGPYDIIDYSLLVCSPIIDYGLVADSPSTTIDYDVITSASTVTVDYKYVSPCRLST